MERTVIRTEGVIEAVEALHAAMGVEGFAEGEYETEAEERFAARVEKLRKQATRLASRAKWLAAARAGRRRRALRRTQTGAVRTAG